MQTTKDLYKLLGLSRDASQEEIRKAHRKLVRKYHPDANPEDPRAEGRFKEIQQAYEVLSNPQKRREYDRQLRTSSRGGADRAGAGASRGGFSRPRPRSASRSAQGGTTYSVDLSELLAKLANLSSERASGRIEGSFQLRGEEVAHLAKLLGEEISRTSKLLSKEQTGLSKLLREKIQMNAKVGFEEDQPGEFSATDEDVWGEKGSEMSGRSSREKKVRGPKAQGRVKRVKGPRARRNKGSS
jgi:curved DNA-binding protein CbpA